MCQNGFFSDFRHPQNGRWDYALGDAYERPGFRPKGVGGSAAWGAPHHRALVALGRS